MTQNIKPIYRDHHEPCPICKKIDTLELYDKNNRPCNYTSILENHDIKDVTTRPVRYFKCKSCKNTFDIDWTWCIPIPLNVDKVKDFIHYCKTNTR